MPFHRLTVPTYFGGLPLSGYDYINNALTPLKIAAADGQKSGGPNDGTYFIAFGEDVTEADANRPNLALAQNCDFLDDTLRRNLGMPVVKTVVNPGGAFDLPGEIFVGMPGTPNTQRSRDGLIAIYTDDGGNLGDPVVVDNVTSFTGAHASSIQVNGGGASIVGDGAPGDGDGFYTDPHIVLNAPLAAGTYHILCYERSNVVNQDEGMLSRLNQGGVGYFNDIVGFINAILSPRNNTWGGKQTVIPPADVDALFAQATGTGRGIYASAVNGFAARFYCTNTSAIYAQTNSSAADVPGAEILGHDVGLYASAAGVGYPALNPKAVVGRARTPQAGRTAVGVFGRAEGSGEASVGVFGKGDDLTTLPTVVGAGGIFWAKGAVESQVAESMTAGVVGIGGANTSGYGGHGVLGIGADSDYTGNYGGLFYGGRKATSGKGWTGVIIYGGDAVGTDQNGGRGLYVEGGSRTGAGQNGLAIWGHYRTGPGGSGYGIRGTGRYGGAGGMFDNNNAQNDRDAVWVNSGVRFYKGGGDTGSQYPDADFGLKNILKAIGIPKLWANVQLTNTTQPTLLDGMNVLDTDYAPDSSRLQIEFAETMDNTDYAVQVTVKHFGVAAGAIWIPKVMVQTQSLFQIVLFDTSGNQVDPIKGMEGGDVELHVVVFGRQPTDDYPSIS